MQSSVNIYCQPFLSLSLSLSLTPPLPPSLPQVHTNRFVNKNPVIFPCVHPTVIHTQCDVVYHILLSSQHYFALVYRDVYDRVIPLV